MNVKKLINEINRSGIMLVILGALFLLTLDDFISSFIGVCLAGSGIIIGWTFGSSGITSISSPNNMCPDCSDVALY